MNQKVFPAEIDFLYEMLEFIKTHGKKNHISTLALEQITLAAEEALVNIISYGYPDEKKGSIDIACEETAPQPGIKIIIKDKGIPFNPIENAPTTPPAPHTILNEAETSLGGYGIYILIGLMDRVEYQRLEDGNMLTLIKYAKSD
jgi:anti-sigma regulatory factor (Ser/Thr protein kinase)